MTTEPQNFDRINVLRQEKERRHMKHLLFHAIDLMTDEERLGEPYREENQIVFPIHQPGAHHGLHDVDPVSLHDMMEAWLDEK